MISPVTLVSGQYGDIPFEQLCALVADIGYDGIEAACRAHVDVDRVLNEEGTRRSSSAPRDPRPQTVGDQFSLDWSVCRRQMDPRLDNFAPTALAGRPEEIQQWAVAQMTTIARAARR